MYEATASNKRPQRWKATNGANEHWIILNLLREPYTVFIVVKKSQHTIEFACRTILGKRTKFTQLNNDETDMNMLIKYSRRVHTTKHR